MTSTMSVHTLSVRRELQVCSESKVLARKKLTLFAVAEQLQNKSAHVYAPAIGLFSRRIPTLPPTQIWPTPTRVKIC